jgi:hypothetical protein
MFGAPDPGTGGDLVEPPASRTRGSLLDPPGHEDFGALLRGRRMPANVTPAVGAFATLESRGVGWRETSVKN